MDEERRLELRQQRVKNLSRMGLGRPKGSRNVVSMEVKAAFVEAFEELGGVEALVRWAKKHPGAFYGLIVKLLPSKAEVNVAGDKVVVQIVGLPE